MDREGIGIAGRIALSLLAANALMLAAGLSLQHWQERPRLPTGYNADKVRLVSEPEPRRKPPPAPAPETAGGQPQPTAAACLRVRLAGPPEYAALRQAMQDAGLGGEDLRMEERLGWWVYWPPVDDPVQQVEVLAALAKAGVKDMAPVRQGPMAGAISLGMFASEADARLHHQSLQRKGLDRIRYGPRPGERSVFLDVSGRDTAQIDRLRAALAGRLTLEEGACRAEPR